VETYFLNLATDAASMRVAARENATTQRSISDLQVILNDLMMSSKINESNRLARVLHRTMVGTLRKRYRVQGPQGETGTVLRADRRAHALHPD
jgi:N-acetylmuramoyl-L-alanine amidase